MKIDQLLYFIETAKHEHIGQAARRLAISPGAISQAIATLEEELGHDLFIRSGKRIYLSDLGKQFYERAKIAVSSFEALKDEFTSAEVELTGKYRIAATHGLSSALLAPVVAKIQKLHPKLYFEIYSLRSAEIIEKAVSGQIDAGICFAPLSHPELQTELLYMDTLQFVVSRSHPILKAPVKDRIRMLSGYPCTLPKAFAGVENCETHPAFAKLGVVPSVAAVFDSYEVALNFVAASLAWSFVPETMLPPYRTRCTVLAHKMAAIDTSVMCVAPKGRPLSRALLCLVSEVKKILE